MSHSSILPDQRDLILLQPYPGLRFPESLLMALQVSKIN
jgi:hypothetical protein